MSLTLEEAIVEVADVREQLRDAKGAADIADRLDRAEALLERLRASADKWVVMPVYVRSFLVKLIDLGLTELRSLPAEDEQA